MSTEQLKSQAAQQLPVKTVLTRRREPIPTIA